VTSPRLSDLPRWEAQPGPSRFGHGWAGPHKEVCSNCVAVPPRVGIRPLEGGDPGCLQEGLDMGAQGASGVGTPPRVYSTQGASVHPLPS
jgi:hypothetical protein